MPSLKELAQNLKDFNYYSGKGNFTQDKIPFGSDNLSGQKSSQPFIVTPNGFRWSPSNFDDGFSQFGTVSLATRTQADVLRIGKFLTTTVKGPLFLLKQAGLQKANVEIEHSNQLQTNKPQTKQGLFTNIENSISNKSNKLTNEFGPTRIYNPLGINTLAQVEGNLVGIHFMRHGMTPKQSKTDEYEKFILEKDKSGNNRLTVLTKELSDKNSQKSEEGFIFKYKGGPGSIYGIGDTTIKRFYNTIISKGSEFENSDDKGFVAFSVNNLSNISTDNTLAIRKSRSQLVSTPDGNTVTSINSADSYRFTTNQDFRSYKNKLIKSGEVKGTIQAETNYSRKNLETRIGVARNRTSDQRTDYASNPGNFDKVNAIATYYSDGPIPTNAVDMYGKKISYNPDYSDPESVSIRDMVKFRIKSIDNDNPKYGHYIVFRSYIDSIKRTMTSPWKEYSYVGRGENFYLYDGFSETINIGFTIAASSRYEMKPLYQKINFLMSTLTPDYYHNKMRGSLSELTVGNFIAYQPGVITSLDISVDDMTNWEIAIDEYEKEKDSDMQELPHMLKCNMIFKPIYNFLPRKSTYKSPFIGIDYYNPIQPGQMWLQQGAKYEKLVENNGKTPTPDSLK